MTLFHRQSGVALFLVMSVIFVTLTTILIGATVILHNLDSGQITRSQAQADASATAGMERVLALYKSGAELDIDGGCAVTDCIDIENINCTSCTADSATYENGSIRFSVKITDLSAQRAVLQVTGLSGFSRAVRTTTVNLGFACGDIITDRDGFEYPTVAIGNQCWMAESLRTKTKRDNTCINGGGVPPCDDASAADAGLGRSCYGDRESNCEEEGALYRWEAAMDNTATEGGQGLCPIGWHVPTDAEWHTLESLLTDEENTCDPGRTGDTEDCNPAGAALFEGGESGFNAAYSGYRHKSDTFEERGNKGFFWASTTDGYPFTRVLTNGSVLVGRGTRDDAYNLSLRCIKN